jgi:hypothetical protein
MLVVETLVSFVKETVERLDRPATHFFHRCLELAPFLSLDRQDVASGVDPASISIDAGQDGGTPLPTIPAKRGEDPHRVDLGLRDALGHRLRETVPAEAGTAVAHTEACSHRSQ